MRNIFVYSEKAELAAELTSFAKNIGNATTNVIALDENSVQDLKNAGADKLYFLKGDNSLPENYTREIANLLKKEDASLFVVGATVVGKDVAARVAGYLDCTMVSDAGSISVNESGFVTEKMMYGGAVIREELIQALSVVTIQSGKYEAIQDKEYEVITIAVKPDPRVKLIGTSSIDHNGVDLAVAERVICIGMGLDNQDDIKMAEDLANVIDAELACTRGIAEERKWLPISSYIGISGAVISPSLYLSMGVSGQIQHVFGIRESKIIVAVDIDEKAKIFKAADYGIVGDMYEIIPLLTEALK